MLTRALSVPLLALLLMLGGGTVADGVASATTVVAKRAKPQCRGLDHADVRGAKPTYTRKRLADFRNDERLCRGLWLPRPRHDLVPQGLAVTGRTAWLSGFRYRKEYGSRPCVLTRVNLATGAPIAYHAAIYGQVGNRPRTYCRHGGGLAQDGKWLWVVEKNKLWRVDPTQRLRKGFTGLEARRVWRLVSPVRGSSLVLTDNRVGIVPYLKRGKARIHWFSRRDLAKRKVLELAVRSAGKRRVGAVATTRIPRYVQGAAIAPNGRLFLARSNLACGELVTPRGRRVAFLPGAEGIHFSADGKRLWVASESGARPYAKSRKPLTPGIASFEWPRLLRGRLARCGFPAY